MSLTSGFGALDDLHSGLPNGNPGGPEQSQYYADHNIGNTHTQNQRIWLPRFPLGSFRLDNKR